MDNGKESFKEKILIVDDSPLVCEMFSNVLSKEGYETVTANDGESALKKLSSEKFLIMLLDLVMPGMNGIEVLHECRKSNPEICIIVITGHSSEETAVGAIREGADDYIEKDFIMKGDNGGLDIIISRGLEKRRLALENIELNKQMKELNVVLQTAYSRVRDEKDYFNNLFSNTAYGVILTKDDGNILGFNDFLLKMTGFTEADLSGMCIFDLIKAESRSEVTTLLKEIRPHTTQGAKTSIVTKAQKNVDVSLNATSFKMGTERVILATIVTCR